ncbi:MAG: hypothetical protein ACFE0J_22160 [Elainellaceae cyanobacterium]
MVWFLGFSYSTVDYAIDDVRHELNADARRRLYVLGRIPCDAIAPMPEPLENLELSSTLQSVS